MVAPSPYSFSTLSILNLFSEPCHMPSMPRATCFLAPLHCRRLHDTSVGLRCMPWVYSTRVDVKLSLPVPLRCVGEWRHTPPFLAAALDEGEWSASHSGHFVPGERAPSTHWIWDWLGPRASPDAVECRKISCPSRESNPGSPEYSPSLYRLSSEAGEFVYFGFILEVCQYLMLCNIGWWDDSVNTRNTLGRVYIGLAWIAYHRG
jgi:hypothetical protein